MDLGAVLAGIAVRRAKQYAQGVVDHAAGAVQQRAVDHAAPILRGHGFAVFRTKHAVQNGAGVRAAQTQYADGGGGLRRGDGGNGIIHRINLLYRQQYIYFITSHVKREVAENCKNPRCALYEKRVIV